MHEATKPEKQGVGAAGDRRARARISHGGLNSLGRESRISADVDRRLSIGIRALLNWREAPYDRRASSQFLREKRAAARSFSR